MVSRVFFVIAVDGKPVLGTDGQPRKLYADVKLPVGGDYLSDRLEVGRPVGYRGPWNHDVFAEAARAYVGTCVGPGARGISFQGGGSIRMMDNQFGMRMDFSFPAPDVEPGTW